MYLGIGELQTTTEKQISLALNIPGGRSVGEAQTRQELIGASRQPASSALTLSGEKISRS